MCAGKPGRLRPDVAERVVQQSPSFARHPSGALNRTAEAVELTRDIVECRLHFTPQLAAVLGEKQVACSTADDSAHQSCDHRSIRHGSLLELRNGEPTRMPAALTRWPECSSNV